jgi:hypothetical protein
MKIDLDGKTAIATGEFTLDSPQVEEINRVRRACSLRTAPSEC